MYTRVLYDVDACPLNKADINSLDFVINVFMTLFCTGDINIVHECQSMFNFKLPSEKLEERKKNFIRKYDMYVMNCSCYYQCLIHSCVFLYRTFSVTVH